MKAPVGLLSGRAVCVSRWRGVAPTSSAERSKRIFTGGVVKAQTAFAVPLSAKARLCGRALAPPRGSCRAATEGLQIGGAGKTVKRSSRRTGVNLQFFPVQPTPLGLKGASSPFFVAPARRNRCDLAVLNAQHLLRKPVCDLKAPLGLSCLAGTAALFFSFGVKREHPSATTSYPTALQLPLFLYTPCKKSTGKLRRTSRLTDTRIFFITAKDPVRGSTPRYGGTSAPRQGPWRPGAARPSPPRGTPPARWGTP